MLSDKLAEMEIKNEENMDPRNTTQRCITNMRRIRRNLKELGRRCNENDDLEKLKTKKNQLLKVLLRKNHQLHQL